MDGESRDMIVRGNGRRLQKQPGRRVKMGKRRQEIFLEELAASCNVRRSAEMAGIGVSTAYKKRMECEEFRAAWRAALDRGYVRLETALIERAIAGADRPEVRGDKPSDVNAIDPSLGLQLLREHKRGLAGIKKPGRPITATPIDELCTILDKRLKAYGIRVDDE